MNEHRVIIVSFLEPKPLFFEFTEWPNHITIVPYFRTTSLEKLSDDIRKACIGTNQILYQIDSIDYFGIKKNVKVSRIKITDALLKLHASLHNVSLNHDKNADKKFSYQGYKPHITHHNEPYPQKDDRGYIKMLYLIEQLPSSVKREKKIVTIINLTQLFKSNSWYNEV